MALCAETLFEVWIQNIIALHQPLKPPDKKKEKQSGESKTLTRVKSPPLLLFLFLLEGNTLENTILKCIKGAFYVFLLFYVFLDFSTRPEK